MSFLRSKHSGWTHEGKRTPFFGGGGGGGTTQSTGTTYNTNIPEYAQPYVETMLGATQKQLFNMDGNEITGFKPYQPYSTNVNDYVAGFSPLQQQAQQATGQLQVPGQYGQASRMTGMAGMGSLGLAGQMAGAGQDYAQQAQDPRSMQGYMSPYMQNVVDYQKTQALRDYGIGQGLRKAQSVGQGAFGGNRQALVESEAQRALGSQIGGIEAQGAQQAFQNAQQAQQYAANLGMQGRQGALQGLGQYGQMGAQLGQLGGQELAARQGIIQSQYGMGQQQQAMEQQKINQAMQDWANTQQYPLMQLGVMSNMLRGLPMQASTTNQYQAAPNALTQGIGAAGAGASLYNALRGGKEGGLPSEFKPSRTGIKSYYEGDVVESTKSDLYDLPLDELEKRAKSSPSPTIKRLAGAIAKEKRMGLNLAGGGIIAFQNRGLVPETPSLREREEVIAEKNTADPALVRQAYIDAANLQNTQLKQSEADYEAFRPKVNPPSSYKLNAAEKKSEAEYEAGRRGPASNLSNPMGEVDIPNTGTFSGIKNAIVERYKRDTAGSPEFLLANKQITQAEYDKIARKPYQLNEAEKQSEADYEAGRPKASSKTLPSPPANVKVDELGRADAAKQDGKPAGIKAAAPAVGAPGQGNLNPAPSDKIMPTAGIKIPGLERPAEDPYAKMSISEIAQEQLKFLGPDVRKEERAGLMAERANAKDEARRAQSLRFAEFFAAWGSTPGSTIAAGLRALQEKVPSIVADDREAAKIRRAINKDIAGLDKADRLEKAGAWDAAAKLKSDLAKNGRQTYGDELNFLSARMSDTSREKVAQINKEGRTTGKDDLAALEGRLNTANSNLINWGKTDRNEKLLRDANRQNPDKNPKIQAKIDAANEILNKDEDYKKLKTTRDNLENLINANKRVIAANEGNPEKPTTSAPSAGKVIQYDAKGNRI
jgi:hypothetical protein